MADYHMPTVVQPSIASTDMSAIELLVLTRMFEYELDEEGAFYFFAETDICEMPEFSRTELQTALSLSSHMKSATAVWVQQQLDADPADTLVLDFTADLSWEVPFRDIIRRSSSVAQVVATSAFTCTRMRPDGFGGMVVLVTADDVFARTTLDMLALLREELHGRGDGDHGLDGPLVLDEVRVRETLSEILALDATYAPLRAEGVGDDDIRNACRSVIAQLDLAELRTQAEVAAAIAALKASRARLPAAA